MRCDNVLIEIIPLWLRSSVCNCCVRIFLEEEEVVTIGEAAVEGVDVLNAPIARGWITLKKIVTPYMVFLTKQHMYLDQKNQNLSSLMRSTKSIWSSNLRNPATKHNLPLYHVFQQHVSPNLLKVLVLGYLIQVPLIISLVSSLFFHPFLSQKILTFYCS